MCSHYLQTYFVIFSNVLEIRFISVNFRLVNSVNGHSGHKMQEAIVPPIMNVLE